MTPAHESERAVLRQKAAGAADQVFSATLYTWLHACSNSGVLQDLGAWGL